MKVLRQLSENKTLFSFDLEVLGQFEDGLSRIMMFDTELFIDEV